MKPNFFIIGAPKCGTTALASYLNDRHDIFISDPKEPHFFADDFPHYKELIPTITEYEQIFDQAEKKGAQKVGEASVWYLYSETAIHNIYSYKKDAKIIIMLRDPVEVIQSLHKQLIWTMDEDEKDIEVALELMETRLNNKNIPKKCREPKFLQYIDVVRFGKQVEKVYKTFPAEQILIIQYDQFRSETKKIYSDVISFLGLPEDGRSEFPRINKRKENKSILVAQMTQRPPRWLVKLITVFKKITGLNKIGLMNKLKKLNARPVMNERMPVLLEQKIRDCLADDSVKLRKYL